MCKIIDDKDQCYNIAHWDIGVNDPEIRDLEGQGKLEFSKCCGKPITVHYAEADEGDFMLFKLKYEKALSTDELVKEAENFDGYLFHLDKQHFTDVLKAEPWLIGIVHYPSDELKEILIRANHMAIDFIDHVSTELVKLHQSLPSPR